MKAHFLFGLSFILYIHAVAAENVSMTVTQVTIQGNAIYYSGPLSPDANAQAFKLYQQAEKKPNKLVISSNGGDIEVGMILGEWIFDHHINVQVDDYCLSSCANYVFPAGRTKYLGNRALIGYHGGARSESFDDSEITQMLAGLSNEERKEVMLVMKNYMTKVKQEESRFYTKIGVDQRISTLGQANKYELYSEKEGYVGWTYHPDDFAKFGVNDVVVMQPPWLLKYNKDNKKVFLVDMD